MASGATVAPPPTWERGVRKVLGRRGEWIYNYIINNKQINNKLIN